MQRVSRSLPSRAPTGLRWSRILTELHLPLLLAPLPVAERRELARPEAIVTLCDLRKYFPTLSHPESQRTGQLQFQIRRCPINETIFRGGYNAQDRPAVFGA